MPSTVTDYLSDLNSALRVGARRQRRIRAEVSDHLAELIAQERGRETDPELAERRAAERFGAPAALAAEFNADVARHRMNRASWALAVCGAAAFVAAGFSPRAAEIARPWPSAWVFTMVTQLWVQVPLTCAGIAVLLSVVAPWLRGRPMGGRPAVLAGRSLTVASVLLLPVAVVAIGNLDTGMPPAELLPAAVVAVIGPVAAIWSLRAAARAGWLKRPGDEEDVLDVIAAAAEALAGRWALADHALRIAVGAWRAARARAPWATSWLDLRRHPWRAAATTSVAAGLALKAPDFLIGDPDFIAAAMEAVTVYGCFAVLGGLLGLRTGRPQDVRDRDRPTIAVTT